MEQQPTGSEKLSEDLLPLKEALEGKKISLYKDIDEFDAIIREIFKKHKTIRSDLIEEIELLMFAHIDPELNNSMIDEMRVQIRANVDLLLGQ